MVLFVSFLFERLPAFVPRGTLMFKGALGAKDDMVQCVELSNPSAQRSMHYAVALEGLGAADFSVDASTVTLAPRGKPGATVKVPIRCRARFSRPVEARLVFTAGAGESGADGGLVAPSPASTLVFTLKTQIVSRVPAASFSASTRAYEAAVVDVRFTNPFAQDCTFGVSVKLEQEPPAIIGGNTNTTGGNNAAGDVDGKASARGSAARMVSVSRSVSAKGGASGAADPVGVLPPVFFSPFERVRLRAGETASLGVQFLPLRVGSYKAVMVLLDEGVGEVALELRGEALPPAPLEMFKWTTSLSRAGGGGGEAKEVQLSFKNAQIEVARAACFERLRNLSRQQRDLKKARPDWNSQTLRADLLPSGPGAQAVLYHTAILPGASSASVSAAAAAAASSPFFQAPPQLLLSDVKLEKDSMLLSKGGTGGGGGGFGSSGARAGAVGVSRRGTASGGPAVITDLTSVSPAGGAAAAAGVGSSKASAAALGYVSTRAGGVSENRFLLAFNPRGGAGVYRGTMLLSSAFDVRAYALEVTVLAEDQPPALEFVAAARQSVTQSIPLPPNTSAEIHVWKAVFTGQSKGFAGPQELSVYPHTTATYPLTFAPSWKCEVSGALTLSNNKTDEKHVFSLSGTGTEPLAEAHLSLAMPARSEKIVKVKVPNAASTTDVYFSVECDLPSFRGAPGSTGKKAAGATASKETFRVAAGDTGEYAFVLAPQVSGVERGVLSFVTPDRKSFSWYGLVLTVAPPEADSEIDVTAPARGAVQVRVPVRNPFPDRTAMFKVELDGAEGLFGPGAIEVAPGQSSSYEFLYAPVRVTPGEEPVEAALRFTLAGPQTGGAEGEGSSEVWHRLLVRATEPEAVAVDFGSATQVGSSSEQEVEVENPLNLPLQLRASVAGKDARCFVTKPATTVTLAPLSRGLVTVQYTPSRIASEGDDASSVQSARLVLSSPQGLLSDYVYLLHGQGCRPSSMPVTRVRAALGTRVSRTLPFRNAFAQRLTVDVELHSASADGSEAGTFQLLLKRMQGLQVQPYSILQIPFLFAPRSVAPHRAVIVVRAVQQQDGAQGLPPLEWLFPLEGEAEGATSLEAPLALDCLARARVEDEWSLRLSGLEAADAFASAAPLSVTVECDDDAQQARLLRFLQLSDASPVAGDSPRQARVRYSFRPLVPFKASAFVVISRNTGAAGLARWRFPLSVTVGAPVPDDTLRLEATVGHTASVAFRLQNFKDSPTPFTAALSLDSGAEFSVWPRTGVLSARGSLDPATGQPTLGAQLVVSFSPVEFSGQALRGRVHVRAGDDMCWSYELRGLHPRYQPPNAVQPQVHTRNETYTRALQSRGTSAGSGVNHLRHNIAALKDMPALADKVSEVRSWKGTGATNSAAIAASLVSTFPAPKPTSRGSTKK